MFLAYRLARVALDKGPLNGRCIFVLYGLFTWSYISRETKPNHTFTVDGLLWLTLNWEALSFAEKWQAI